MKILKLIAAVFSGLMMGLLLIDILHRVGTTKLPIDDSMTRAVVSLSLAFIIGSFIGGIISHLIGRQQMLIDSLLTGLILTILGVYFVVVNEMPVSMKVISIICFMPTAFLGGKLVNRKSQ